MEAINRIDAIKPNGYSMSEKIKWLSTLDGIIKREIIDTHEGAEKVTFNGYDENSNLSTMLLVSAPYDDIYIRWLEAQIDYANNEYGKYNNSITLYNSAYANFERYYNRTHMPIGKRFKYFGEPNTKEYQAANSVVKISMEED
jgi:hypothetical protein